MTLWINAIFGYPTKVETDLLIILQGDLGFGDELVITDSTVWQITYRQTVAGNTQSRMSALINTAFAQHIVVTGVDGTYGFQNGPYWQPIQGVGGGLTVVSKSTNCVGGAPQYNSDLIIVVYDASECDGQGHWVRDVNSNKVNEPTHVILYHELSHAYHWANRSSTQCTTGETQTVSDENVLRTQFGMPRRSLTRLEGGCGAPSPYNPWDGICFIVTAVAGSPRAELVIEFHRIRDTLLRPTALGRALFDAIFAEYYQCAPRIVRDMQANPALMRQISRLVVDPLLDILTLVRLHVQDDLRSDPAQVRRLLAAGRRCLAVQGASNGTAGRLATLAGDLVATAADDAADTSAEATYRYLATAIRSGAPTIAALDWSFARLLAIYWRAVAEDGASDPAGNLAEAIETWLADAPVDWTAPGVAADLRALRSAVMRADAVRHRFGARLLARQDLPPEVPGMLRAAGFLAEPV